MLRLSGASEGKMYAFIVEHVGLRVFASLSTADILWVTLSYGIFV